MREDAILSLENVVVLFPGCLVVGIPVHATSFQISDLSDSLFSIAHLLIQKTGLLSVRVNIGLSTNNVVNLTASIVNAFAMVE